MRHLLRFLIPACVLLIVLSVLVPLFPIQAAVDSPPHTMDEALLLMIASQARLYEEASPLAGQRMPGLSAPVESAFTQAIRPGDINELRRLSAMYQGFADHMPHDDPLRTSFEDKARTYRQGSQELEVLRRRQLRANNPFRRFVSTVSRAPGRLAVSILRPVGKLGGHVIRGVGRIGKVVLIVARDEVIFRARQIVRARIDDLVDLARGRVDLVLNRIAAKMGFPAAELLRQFLVDPALARARNQLLRAVEGVTGRSVADAGSEGSGEDTGAEDDDFEPDFSRVDEEGDTDYDDEDITGEEGDLPAPPEEDSGDSEATLESEGEETTATGSPTPDAAGDPNVEYDVFAWFPEENLAAICKEIAGSYAHGDGRDLHVFNEYVPGGEDPVSHLTCNYRSGDSLLGADIQIDAFNTEANASPPIKLDYSRCGTDQVSTTTGQVLCGPEPSTYIELRDCAIGDCAGCQSWCDTFIWTQDHNSWIRVMLTTSPDDPDRLGQVRSIVDHIRLILAAKRSGAE